MGAGSGAGEGDARLRDADQQATQRTKHALAAQAGALVDCPMRWASADGPVTTGGLRPRWAGPSAVAGRMREAGSRLIAGLAACSSATTGAALDARESTPRDRAMRDQAIDEARRAHPKHLQ
jgi:hypothetical protein